MHLLRYSHNARSAFLKSSTFFCQSPDRLKTLFLLSCCFLNRLRNKDLLLWNVWSILSEQSEQYNYNQYNNNICHFAIPLLIFFLFSIFSPFLNPQINLINEYTYKVNQKKCTKCVKHRTCWISHSNHLLLFLCILRFSSCRTASAAASTVATASGASDMFPFFMVLISFINEKNTISDN